MYRFTLDTVQYLGDYLLYKAVPSLVLNLGETDSVTGNYKFKTCSLGTVNSSGGTFDVHVYQPTIGTNTWLDSVPTDLAGNDSIAVTVSVIRDTSVT